MPEQLSFDLPRKTALGRKDFFVSPANAQAVEMIEDWANWPNRKLALAAPIGAGKTHLAHVWSELAGATIIQASDLSKADIPGLSQASVAVEDCDEIFGNDAGETALFHLHNLALAEGHSLLLTARSAPYHWKLTLPDLASRATATTVATIDTPDDKLLAAVMSKQFLERQLSPPPAVISYLVQRTERSFEAIEKLVAALDDAALDKGRNLSVKLAGEVLDKLKS